VQKVKQSKAITADQCLA